MNTERKKISLRTKAVVVSLLAVLILVALILVGVRSVSNANPIENDNTITEAKVMHTNASSDVTSQLYNAMLNRETDFTLNGGNSSDVYARLESEELFNEVASIDDPNTSDDFDYLFNNLDTYTITDNGGSVDVSITWNEDKAMLDKVNVRVKEILQQTGVYNMNNAYDIAKTLHDYIVNNVEYDNSLSKYTAYSALFEKSTVCQGYSLLYYKLLTEAGVSCRYITGSGNGESHSWNLVKVGDAWYNVDVTWDDPEGGSLTYDYFLKGSSSFNREHSRDSKFKTDSFNSAYPTSQSDFSKNNYGGNDVRVPSNNENVSNSESNPNVDGGNANTEGGNVSDNANIAESQEATQSTDSQAESVVQNTDDNQVNTSNSVSSNDNNSSSSSVSVNSRVVINGEVVSSESYNSNDGNVSTNISTSVNNNSSVNLDNLGESINSYVNGLMNSIFGGNN